MRHLVTGATGYIGGRLAPRLLGHGPDTGRVPSPDTGPTHVRCLVRYPDALAGRAWADDVEIVRGDLLDPESVRAACADVDVVHLLAPEAVTARAAPIVAGAARDAGVHRIVHLGRLHPGAAPVAETLLRAEVPAVVLRAAMVLGPGAASFEILRHLTERLPVLAPGWADRPVQPIAVRDVLDYLVGAAELPGEPNRTFDVGGPDVLTYLEMMRRYAAVAGLPPRRVLPLPGRSPAPAAHWAGVVSPVPASVARPLIEPPARGAVCTEDDIRSAVPDPPGGLLGFGRTVELALARTVDGDVETRWSDATAPGVPSDPLPADLGGEPVYLDERARDCAASPERLWQVVAGIGGERGWYSFPLAWSVRGWMDRAAGGVGLTRGRRDPDTVRTGDAVDWWRVERVREPGGHRPPADDLPPAWGLLRLRAEMKVSGRAWLEMSVAPRGGGSTYRQRAVFIPHGVAGRLYWWSVAPFHGIVFGGMVRSITRAAERAGHGPVRHRASRLRARRRSPDRAA
ncbi:SDR family oxidoreductase [Pseudonocardia sp. C8]|uniref:SDR family oxidoreductase n=1 Tax=Pseudonocardia sp. C8 TaxID=2762759 RepID=UPI001642D536|nr:SDR family oxidoreductase [Pseudonocardia sp. C8]